MAELEVPSGIFDDKFDHSGGKNLFSLFGNSICEGVLRTKFGHDVIPLMEVLNYGMAHMALCGCLGIPYNCTKDKIIEAFELRTDTSKVNKNIFVVETVASYCRSFLKVLVNQGSPKRKVGAEKAYQYEKLMNVQEDLEYFIPVMEDLNPEAMYASAILYFGSIGISITDNKVKNTIKAISDANILTSRVFNNAMRPIVDEHALKGRQEIPQCLPLYMYVGSFLSCDPLEKKALDDSELMLCDQILNDQPDLFRYTTSLIAPGLDKHLLGDGLPQMLFTVMHGCAYRGCYNFSKFGESFAGCSGKLFFFNASLGYITSMTKFRKIKENDLTPIRKHMCLSGFNVAPQQLDFPDHRDSRPLVTYMKKEKLREQYGSY